MGKKKDKRKQKKQEKEDRKRGRAYIKRIEGQGEKPGTIFSMEMFDTTKRSLLLDDPIWSQIVPSPDRTKALVPYGYAFCDEDIDSPMVEWI